MQDPAAPASSLDALRHLPWVDQVGLAALGLCLLLGFWRGLWWQVMRLVGVVASVGAARTFAPRFAPEVFGAFDISSSAAYALVWFGIFLGGLIVASVIGLLGKRALDALQLGLVDRFGGALAGALTGLILHSAFLILITGMGETEWSQRTLQDARSKRLLDVVSNRWPILVDAKTRKQVVEPWADALGLKRPSSPK